MGFMETSAKLKVNIEETFALIVRRVVEARKEAAEYQPSANGTATEKRRTGADEFPQRKIQDKKSSGERCCCGKCCVIS